MNEYCKQLESLDAIPKVNCEGYIWISDENKPRRVTCTDELLKVKGNPFIVEGHLKSIDNSWSISIQEYGGIQLVYQYDLRAIDALPAEQKTEISLLVHRFDTASKIKMTLVWLPENDNIGADMEVLKPAIRVFNGFEFKK